MKNLYIISIIFSINIKATLPYKEEITNQLSNDFNHFFPAFQNEMGYLLNSLRQNLEKKGNFIHSKINHYFLMKSIFPPANEKKNEKIINRGIELDISKSSQPKDIKILARYFFNATNEELDELKARFIQEPSYFLETAFFILNEIGSGKAYQEKWASKLFALYYLTLFFNIEDIHEIQNKITEIKETFAITSQHLKYDPNHI